MTQRSTRRRRRPSKPSRLKRLLRLLRARIQFTRRDGKWGVIVFAPPAAAAAAEPANAAADDAPDRFAELRTELTLNLDRHRLSRSVMPALALLERALSRRGSAGLTRLAAPVLWDAVNQLNVLSECWEGTQLPALRRELTAALGLDESDMDMLCANDEALDVDDARLSEFMEVMHQWDRRSPAPEPPARPEDAPSEAAR
jgi:hypothetical protein